MNPGDDLPAAPGYGQGNLVEVLPSVAAGLGVPGFRDVLGLGDVDRVVVLLVDGLGSDQLAAAGDLAPTLDGMPGGRLSAGFPTTTPVGLACLGTGLAPGTHGLVGAAFRLDETGHVLAALKWQDQPNPVATQPQPTVLERAERAGVAVTVVGPRSFAASGLTRAVLRGGTYRGADSVGERLAEVATALAHPADGARRALVYVYWGDLDRTGHVHGVASPHWRAELSHVDRIVESLVAVLPADAVLHVTADHGMVDCRTRVDLDRDPGLRDGVAVLAGEPRARHVYARPGAARDVLAAWTQVLGEHAWVVARRTAIDAGWFGEVAPEYRHRIGDVLAIARSDVALTSAVTDRTVSGLLGQHGSLTRAETDVPLLTWRA